jgi:hypothetical protein
MQDLAFRAPPSLAITEGATTPPATKGVTAWSTVLGKLLVWNGAAWVSVAPAFIALSTALTAVVDVQVLSGTWPEITVITYV